MYGSKKKLQGNEPDYCSESYLNLQPNNEEQ